MKKSALTSIFVMIVILTLGVGFYLNRVYLSDLFMSMQYKEPAEVAEIEKGLRLTRGGSLIFRATKPELQDKVDFNANCRETNANISILGCYVGGRIHVYNIQSDELEGIIESTAAHELLHAVWERMDRDEKKRVGELLTEVYESKEHHEDLVADLKNYTESETLDELHSRIGTEIKNLPMELEKHYAKYFEDQDLVVDYYDNYNDVFTILKNERTELESWLKQKKQEIETKISEYESERERLMGEVQEFNNCATTAGCFDSQTVFWTRREQLLNWQDELNNQYGEIDEMISAYNIKVQEYNDNLLHGTELNNIINSAVQENNLIQ